MEFNLPVKLKFLAVSTGELDRLSAPRLTYPHLQVDEHDYFLKVHNVADYRVTNGNHVQIYPHEQSDWSSVQLFLNGSVLGAVLHQRRILCFHGSSFSHQGKGVMLCGHSGSGKSAITAVFCQNGSRLISDDITPVRISSSGTSLIPLNSHIKLWDDTLLKLKIENRELVKIRPSLNKFYFPHQEVCRGEQSLNHIFIIGTHNKDEFQLNELDGMAKYNLLRQQIYRKNYLNGMPETAKLYFRQLFELARTVRVTRILRPEICDIYTAAELIKNEVAG